MERRGFLGRLVGAGTAGIVVTKATPAIGGPILPPKVKRMRGSRKPKDGQALLTWYETPRDPDRYAVLRVLVPTRAIDFPAYRDGLIPKYRRSGEARPTAEAAEARERQQALVRAVEWCDAMGVAPYIKRGSRWRLAVYTIEE